MTLIAPLPFMFRESCANLTASIKDKRLSLPELLYLSATLFDMHTPNHAPTPSPQTHTHTGIDTDTPTHTHINLTHSLIPIKFPQLALNLSIFLQSKCGRDYLWLFLAGLLPFLRLQTKSNNLVWKKALRILIMWIYSSTRVKRGWSGILIEPRDVVVMLGVFAWRRGGIGLIICRKGHHQPWTWHEMWTNLN